MSSLFGALGVFLIVLFVWSCCREQQRTQSDTQSLESIHEHSCCWFHRYDPFPCFIQKQEEQRTENSLKESEHRLEPGRASSLCYASISQTQELFHFLQTWQHIHRKLVLYCCCCSEVFNDMNLNHWRILKLIFSPAATIECWNCTFLQTTDKLCLYISTIRITLRSDERRREEKLMSLMSEVILCVIID